MRAVQSIDEVLSDGTNNGILLTGDPLVDKWEKALERGEEPDLTEGMDALPARLRRRVGLEKA